MASNQEGRQINSAFQGPKIPHSHFTLNKRVGITSKFGVNEPIFATELVTDDGPITIEPNCDIRSYTLKAPMIGTIQKHVSAYQVPLQAILPFNWDKIVKNPSRGTDVVGETAVQGLVPCLDGVNTVISEFATKIWTSFNSDFTAYRSAWPDPPVTGDPAMINFINHTLWLILKYEMFYSQGSLIARLGAHFGANVRFVDSVSYDIFSFDRFCELLLTSVSRYRFRIDDADVSNFVPASSGVKHVRRVLDFMRSHKGPFAISVPTFVGPKPSFDIENISVSFHFDPNDSEPYNYGRCCAYQLCNAHFFTNGKIDYINTADLYRQYIGSLLESYSPLSQLLTYPSTFDFNGVSTQYDYLSGFYISAILDAFLVQNFGSSSFYLYTYPVLSAIFGFNYSLRYMDYFVGARPKNLAVGDTTIRVDNNTVQVVDVTKNIVKQRFLNAVARVSNTIEDYSNKILGKRLEYDYHNPKYLFSFDANVFTSEVENTGNAQVNDANSVTAVMRGNFKNHQFTFSVDRHSYVILIEYTDFARFYYTTQDRKTMAIDRFDMFVPELQYVGDQELRRSELLAGAPKELPFAYTLRDMQFKQEVDECSGGFIDFLPGWLFKYNPLERYEGDLENLVISPEFIRSQPTELDDFYLKLSNMSLAGYFHFIEMWDIKISANRPMAYAPQIL